MVLLDKMLLNMIQCCTIRCTIYSMPEKDLVCPNMYVKCRKAKMSGYLTASRCILQANHHAFLAILTHNPLLSM